MNETSTSPARVARPLDAPVGHPANGTYWCKSHKRVATHADKTGWKQCDPSLGGILLPCHVVLVCVTEADGFPCIVIDSAETFRREIRRQMDNKLMAFASVEIIEDARARRELAALRGHGWDKPWGFYREVPNKY